MIGESEDGAYLYFVADGVLDNNDLPVTGAQGGQPNLYVRHEGKTSLVAVLSDATPRTGASDDLSHLTGRVSPNGRYLAFMSDREAHRL